MKAITKEETLNNRFCKFNKRTNQVTITKPKKEQVLKMHKRTICLYIASSGLKYRSVENWLNYHTKEEIINLFF